jgi:hypothetical protein
MIPVAPIRPDPPPPPPPTRITRTNFAPAGFVQVPDEVNDCMSAVMPDVGVLQFPVPSMKCAELLSSFFRKPCFDVLALLVVTSVKVMLASVAALSA